jgi:ATP citrate (pro-S)-lyase
MSAKAIREATGKELFNKYLTDCQSTGVRKCKFASVNETTDWSQLAHDNQWLESEVSKSL